MLRCEPGTMQVRKLIRVQLDRQPGRSRRREDARRLGRRERNAFAEGVDRIRKSFPRQHGDHRADRIDVAILVTLRLERERVGAQEGGCDLDRALAAEPARGTQHARLGVEIESIAGLDLDRRDALCDEPIKPRQTLRQEIILAGRACRSHGGEDAATLLRDVLVACPFQAQFELVGTVAGIDQMGVTIDETRRDPTAVERDPLGRVPATRQLSHRAGEHDAPISRGDGARLARCKTFASRREGCQTSVEPNPVEAHGRPLDAFAKSLHLIGEAAYCRARMQEAVVTSFLFDHALLPDGWAHNVRLDVANGMITRVAPSAPRNGAEHVRGIALPGLPNVHCHSFQKGMAGLAERRGPDHDSFWTWRQVMYRFLAALTPEDVEAIAAYAYMEMLEAGFTAVGEFHYLHHDIDGRPYADIAEMAARIAAAAAQTCIGLTLLPSFYGYGGFGGSAPAAEHRRFLNDPERFLKIVARTREIATALPTPMSVSLRIRSGP